MRLNLQEELVVRSALKNAINHLRATGPQVPVDFELCRALEVFESQDPTYFYAEMTDTFGGESNYCWVNRFKVKASSFLGAINKVAKETGYHFRCTGDYGDSKRYDARRAAICCFVDYWDDNHHGQQTVKEI